MRADRVKLERLMEERTALLQKLHEIEEQISGEQSLCTCPDVITKENGERYCPDCFFSWTTDY